MYYEHKELYRRMSRRINRQDRRQNSTKTAIEQRTSMDRRTHTYAQVNIKTNHTEITVTCARAIITESSGIITVTVTGE
jgi:hypothetical protein